MKRTRAAFDVERCALSRQVIGFRSLSLAWTTPKGDAAMADQRRPLQPGEPASAFTLPAANREGTVSLDSLRGRPFLIGFYRGLHCPFCRRQVLQLARVEPAL